MGSVRCKKVRQHTLLQQTPSQVITSTENKNAFMNFNGIFNAAKIKSEHELVYNGFLLQLILPS